MIYPPLTPGLCVLTKWARHMGFCVTYTSLLMKTWRWVHLKNQDLIGLNKLKVDKVKKGQTPDTSNDAGIES